VCARGRLRALPTPLGGGEHLLHEARDHGAAHDGRALAGKAKRHELDAQVVGGVDGERVSGSISTMRTGGGEWERAPSAGLVFAAVSVA
jgi:hypothetical protein